MALKKVSLSVINDLVTDNRVHKVTTSLQQMGFEPTLIGRVLTESKPVVRSYRTKRMRLLFRKGFLFYLEYNVRLFGVLITTNFDLFVANDLDTLPANYLASLLKGKPLVYDSHEYFTEVPELISRPVVKKVWETLEQFLVPRVHAAYTVCQSIADIYREKYKVDFKVIRNLPEKIPGNLRQESPSVRDGSSKVIIYQGALNIGRGLESAIRAMPFLEDVRLMIVGDGDISDELKHLTKELGIEEKVKFFGRIPLNELPAITRQADLGISLEEDLGLNYRYALPNKIFDYIQAEIPLLISNLPEMKRIVLDYEVGEIAEHSDPQKLAQHFKEMLWNLDKMKIWKQNLQKASVELCWENEEKVLVGVYSAFLV